MINEPVREHPVWALLICLGMVSLMYSMAFYSPDVETHSREESIDRHTHFVELKGHQVMLIERDANSFAAVDVCPDHGSGWEVKESDIDDLTEEKK